MRGFHRNKLPSSSARAIKRAALPLFFLIPKIDSPFNRPKTKTTQHSQISTLTFRSNADRIPPKAYSFRQPETMSETPPHSLNDSIGQCGSNDEPLPPPLKPPSHEPARIPSPDLLIFNLDVPRSPTLTLPEDFKFPDPPVVLQNTTGLNQSNKTSTNPVEPQQQQTALEICKYLSSFYSDLRN